MMYAAIKRQKINKASRLLGPQTEQMFAKLLSKTLTTVSVTQPHARLAEEVVTLIVAAAAAVADTKITQHLVLLLFIPRRTHRRTSRPRRFLPLCHQQGLTIVNNDFPWLASPRQI